MSALPATATRSTPHQRRLARRAAAKAQRVSEDKTAPVSAPRQRERHLPDAAGQQTVLEHNTWDDVEWEESDRLAAERLIAAQTPAPVPPGKALEEALLDIWDVVDPDEDGVLSFRELRDNLLDAMPTAPTDLHASVMAALKEGAFLMHDNGAAAYRENDFV